MTELDTRLNDVLEQYGLYVYYEGDPKRGRMTRPEALAAIKAAVGTYVVGEDVVLKTSGERNRLDAAQNELRATQRKLLEGGE